MTKSIYLHIPFCIKKCAYCSFISGTNLDLMSIYTDKLCEEIKKFYDKTLLNTVYFGGGTPSLLELSQVEKILSLLNFDENTEITLEVNPKTVDLNKLKGLKSLGINRISLGVQSFNDTLLKAAGRIHTSEDALKTIDEIRLAGFKNLSIDLIYGLPFDNIENWKNTLKQAKSLELEHISLYGLKIEEGTPFYSNPPKNLPDEDTQALMYEIAMEELSDFYHYEFSNFAKDKNHPSRHNLTYWNLAPYWGFGLGASGFVNLKRYINETNLKNYLDNPIKEKNYEPKDMQKLLEEYIFLGFRKQEGIILKEINEKFQIDFEKKYQKILEKYLKTNHLETTKEGYKLTREGVLVSNYILCDFID